jgi:hypothetical protein
MSLEKKYGLSQAHIKAMYLGGDIPCSVFRRDQIVCFHRRQIESGVSKTDAVYATAEEFKISPQHVWRQLKM